MRPYYAGYVKTTTEDTIRVEFGDGIATDTAVEREQDLRELGIVFFLWGVPHGEYHMKWYGG